MMMDPDKAHYVAATAIVIKDGKYLIARRAPSEKVSPNKWTVPGGKLTVQDYFYKPKDTDDAWYNTFENVLRREVKEEVGLNMNSSPT